MFRLNAGDGFRNGTCWNTPLEVAEALPPDALDDFVLLRRDSPVPIAGGETLTRRQSFRPWLLAGAFDVVQPDVMYLGGISRSLQVCRMAEAAGLPVTPHAANLSLVTMCTMHLLGAIPNAGKYLEFSIEEEDYYPWQYGLFLGDPYRIEDGRATIPDAPGWGIEINPAWLEKAKHRASEI